MKYILMQTGNETQQIGGWQWTHQRRDVALKSGGEAGVWGEILPDRCDEPYCMYDIFFHVLAISRNPLCSYCFW